MGYIILIVENLNISSSYARLDPKAKAVLDTWPILTSSEKSRRIRQAAYYSAGGRKRKAYKGDTKSDKISKSPAFATYR